MSKSLGDIASLIGADIPSASGGDIIDGVASLQDAGDADISFLSNKKYARFLGTTRAKAVIIPENIDVPENIVPLAVTDPYLAFLRVLEMFNDRSPHDIADGISERATIDPSVSIGENVSVGPGAVIGAGVTVGTGTVIGPGTVLMTDVSVGENCVLYPNVTIMDGCEIGDRVVLHAGVVIGSDGFGFAPSEGKYHKIPQIGTVRIENDVEIGANTCVDRAAFGATVIEAGTKLDNLIQVAHNVRIGPNTVLASQVGISGSTTIGKGCQLGGQAGLAGHLHVGDGASVGAQAGVTKDVQPGDIVSGYPAKHHMTAMREEAALRKLPELMCTVRDLEKRIKDLENKNS